MTLWRDSMLDRRGPDPLWMQLRDQLREAIVTRILSPGALLPTEEELRRSHGVSRSVVRQALASLEAEGLIDRRPGRGSVVTTPLAHHRRAEQAGGLREYVASLGMELRTDLQSFGLVDTPSEVAGDLESSRAWELYRVRFIDGVPAIAMRTWVPYDRFPGLNADLIRTGSLLETLARLGARPCGGPRHFKAVAAPQQAAHDLGVTAGTPVMLMTGVTTDFDGAVLEAFHAWHQPEMIFNTDARVLIHPPSEASLRA